MGRRDLGTQEKYLASSLKERDLTLLEVKLLGHFTIEHRKRYRSQEGEEWLSYLLLPTP